MDINNNQVLPRLSFTSNEILQEIVNMDPRIAKIVASGITSITLIFNGIQNICQKNRKGIGTVKIASGLLLATYTLSETFTLVQSVRSKFNNLESYYEAEIKNLKTTHDTVLRKTTKQLINCEATEEDLRDTIRLYQKGLKEQCEFYSDFMLSIWHGGMFAAGALFDSIVRKFAHC